LDVLKNPVDHSCGNSFCSDCIKSVSSCPICRKKTKPDDYKPASVFMKDSISSLKVVCTVCGKGMTHEEFNASHDKNCSFPCPFRCGEQVNCSTLEKHCKNGICKKYLLSCPASEPPLSCKWHGHGGPEYDKHISECALIPFIPFTAFIQAEISALRSSVDQLQSSVDKLLKGNGICDHRYDRRGRCSHCGKYRKIGDIIGFRVRLTAKNPDETLNGTIQRRLAGDEVEIRWDSGSTEVRKWTEEYGLFGFVRRKDWVWEFNV